MRKGVIWLWVMLAIVILGIATFFLLKIYYSSDKIPEESKNANLSSSCICEEDSYNCGDFENQEEAQACFEACGGVVNDIHKLDRDGNGLACESLS